jgi:solute carrier family 25 carnitine/acylcarnitine transporter 20/29
LGVKTDQDHFQHLPIFDAYSPLGLYRGISATMSRDAVYTLGLLGITPVIQNGLAKKYEMNQSIAGFWASIVGGAVCGIISCPFDVVKTCMQGDIQQATHKSFLKTLHAQRMRLWSGVNWRCANLIGTIMIANEFRCRVAPRLFPDQF